MSWDEFGVAKRPMNRDDMNRGLFGLDRGFVPATGATGDHHLVTIHTLSAKEVKKAGDYRKEKPILRLHLKVFAPTDGIRHGELTNLSENSDVSTIVASRSSVGQTSAVSEGRIPSETNCVNNRIDWRTEAEPAVQPLPERAELEAADAALSLVDPAIVSPEEIQAMAILRERGMFDEHAGVDGNNPARQGQHDEEGA